MYSNYFKIISAVTSLVLRTRLIRGKFVLNTVLLYPYNDYTWYIHIANTCSAWYLDSRISAYFFCSWCSLVGIAFVFMIIVALSFPLLRCWFWRNNAWRPRSSNKVHFQSLSVFLLFAYLFHKELYVHVICYLLQQFFLPGSDYWWWHCSCCDRICEKGSYTHIRSSNFEEE